jgi:AGCS family alanine or glycine:cation symporter
MGNIAGVALAIHVGGPGAVFWMWMTAILGIATKFFTCSLAVMYRGHDSRGVLQGGPMYVIREGLGPRWLPLAYLFAVAGLLGALPAFQANQLVQIMRDLVIVPSGLITTADHLFVVNLMLGVTIAALVSTVVFGGIRRIARVTGHVVQIMAALYAGAASDAIILNIEKLPDVLSLIINDAFTGTAVAGGTLGSVILIGVQRGAYSNEAGIGTEALAHGAVRTSEPIREGLVAMVGPIIDTLIICSATAFMILLSGVWLTSDANGVTLTANAFSQLLGPAGTVIIFVCVVCFSGTTLLTYSYYGAKCFSFLFGADRQHWYGFLYVGFIVVAAVVTLEAAIGVIDGAFAIMAIPTMVSTLLLAPRVKVAADRYFASLRG